MAKAAPPAPPAPVPPPAPVDTSKWDMGLAIPAGGVFGGKKGKPGEAWDLEDMPVNASKLLEVEVPDSVTDANERDKYFGKEQAKAYNRATSTLRRFREQDEAHKLRAFTVRKVADATYGYGVRFWRLADTAK